jgi:hypothetical protein
MAAHMFWCGLQLAICGHVKGTVETVAKGCGYLAAARYIQKDTNDMPLAFAVASKAETAKLEEYGYIAQLTNQ